MSAENINRRLNIYINDKEVVNSMGGITRGMNQTRNAIRNLEKGTENYDVKLKALKETYKKLSEEQAKTKAEISEMPSLLQKVKNSLGPVASGMIAAFSIGSLVSGAMAALGNAKRVIFEFEQGLADLSAITGASGKDLEFLKNSAITLGETTQGGAVAVVEAYKLIASAKPELLSNVEALNSVTEATLLLAKASGMEMPLAATKLTDAMNQFGAPADEAAKYVDVLAAGAKYGAAEIPQLTDAILEFGAVAKVSNVDIKESVGLVELLAEKGLKGAQAGNAIKNILLEVNSGFTTSEARDELDRYGISWQTLKDKSIPFSEKLEMLKPLLADTNSIVNTFKKENAAAAISLIENTTRLKELTSQVGEFGVAEAQAAIKMDTVNNKTELLKSKYDSLIISIGNGKGVVSEFFKFFIDGASNGITMLNRMNSSWNEIYGKAAAKGKTLGESDFEKRMQSAGFATSTDVEKANMVLDKALAERTELLKRKNENNKKVLEHTGEKAYLGLFGEAGASKRAKAEQEQLILDIAARDAIIRKAKAKMNPLKNDSGSSTSELPLSVDEAKAADAAAKKREKSIEDRKKHSEELKKELETSQKELLTSQRAGQDAEFAGQKESYDKELGLLNEEYDRKIEDTKIKVSALQAEIAKLNTDAKDPKNTKEDTDVIKATIASKIAAQKEYTGTLVSIEQQRGLKIGTLQEKYLEKSFQKEQEDHARKILLLKTDQDNQLAGITTLAQAKEILSATMSEKELRGVTTLEEAKKIIKANYLKEQLKLELENLDKIVTSYKAALDVDSPGFILLSDEEKDKLTAALDEANAKIAALKLTMSGGEDPVAKEKGGDVDILGFTKDQWSEAFTNIDSLEGALSAVMMVTQSLTTAFSAYFKFLEAGEARQLQKFQKSADGKKKALADQLEKGIITQEVYNARMAKIDQDLAKKKAEIEYKQAKRQKQMALVNAFIGTAVAVINALSTQPVWAGIAMGAIIGTMGALNIATIAKQPLPDKSGFYDGGYTGSGNERNSPGPVHYDEYVVPKKVLFSNDPVVPNIVGYLEAKRTGKQPTIQDDSGSASATSQGGSASASTDLQLINAFNRNSAILEKIEDEGLQAYLVNDYQAAKKMRDKIKEVTKLETNAKP